MTGDWPWPWFDAVDLASRIASRQLSVTTVAQLLIARIERMNPTINAFVHFDPAQVSHDARRLQDQVDRGLPLGPLHGVPYAAKEITAMEGLPLTFGFKPLQGATSTRDAAIIRRLRNAGGLFLGKTNTPEAAYYGGCDGHLYGATHNPWKQGYSAGGSSGGSAAAVAAGMTVIAEGSDGAGSIRIPASLSGVFGMKPSLGRIAQSLLASRHYNWVFQGPITRTVRDAALMMNVLVGPESEDPLSFPGDGVDYLERLHHGIEGWRIAWSPDLGTGQYVDPEVLSVCERALGVFEKLGATVHTATPPWPTPHQAMWDGIWVPGYAASYDLLDWDRMHGQVDDNFIEVMRTVETTTTVQTGRADAFRGQMWATFETFMADYDLLVSPTLSSAAFPLTQFAPDWLTDAPLQDQLLGWLQTYPYNLLTNPAASVPAGFTSDGRPVGLQLGGGHRADAQVLCAAAAFERAQPWTDQWPAIATTTDEVHP